MTEAEWRDGHDLDAMLGLVADRTGGERLLRLFACACSLPVWADVTEECCAAAVVRAYRAADGFASEDELKAAFEEAQNGKPLFPDANWAAAWAAAPEPLRAALQASAAAAAVLARPEAEAAQRAAWGAVRAGARPEERADAWRRFEDATAAGQARARAAQADYLRDIVGDPFRAAAADPAWLTWQGGAVVQVARALHDEDRFDGLPVLADALEEAGCTDEAILSHCRGGGPHVRGCWVVDLILRAARDEKDALRHVFKVGSA